jgi:type IV pilus assembly protein PilW
MSKPSKQMAAGYTLVEVVLALGLSLVTMSVLYSLYVTELNAQIVREHRLDMQQTARIVMDLVTREIMMAGYDPAGRNRDADESNDFHGIMVDEKGLHIKADLNGNGSLGDSNESILYSHDPSTLMLRRNTGGGNQPFGEDIEAFHVNLIDRWGIPTTNASEVSQVELMITARSPISDPKFVKNGGYRTVTLQSRITPRSLLR